MNTAQSLFGISQLEAAKKVEASKGYFDNSYIIELSNGELVTIKELCDFWIEGHEKIDKATASVNKAIDITEKYFEGKECNTIGKDTSIQSQSTGKKSRKSTKKMTITQK